MTIVECNAHECTYNKDGECSREHIEISKIDREIGIDLICMNAFTNKRLSIDKTIYREAQEDYKFILNGAKGEVRSIYNRIRDLNSIRKSYLNNTKDKLDPLALHEQNNQLLKAFGLNNFEEIEEMLKVLINRLITIETNKLKSYNSGYLEPVINI